MVTVSSAARFFNRDKNSCWGSTRNVRPCKWSSFRRTTLSPNVLTLALHNSLQRKSFRVASGFETYCVHVHDIEPSRLSRRCLYRCPSSKIHGLPFCVVLRTKDDDKEEGELSLVDSLLILEFNELFVSSIDVSNSCLIDVSLTIGFWLDANSARTSSLKYKVQKNNFSIVFLTYSSQMFILILNER